MKKYMIAKVFRNLHHKGIIWSVQIKVEHRWLTLSHCKSVIIKNAKFVVQPAGHRKVLETKVKNVHAFIQGELVVDPHEIKALMDRIEKTAIQIYYNPYKVNSFVEFNGFNPVFTAEAVCFDKSVRALTYS